MIKIELVTKDIIRARITPAELKKRKISSDIAFDDKMRDLINDILKKAKDLYKIELPDSKYEVNISYNKKNVVITIKPVIIIECIDALEETITPNAKTTHGRSIGNCEKLCSEILELQADISDLKSHKINKKESNNMNRKTYRIYYFKNFENLTHFIKRIYNVSVVDSQLIFYKYKYFLLIFKSQNIAHEWRTANILLGDFGEQICLRNVNI